MNLLAQAAEAEAEQQKKLGNKVGVVALEEQASKLRAAKAALSSQTLQQQERVVKLRNEAGQRQAAAVATGSELDRIQLVQSKVQARDRVFSPNFILNYILSQVD